MIICRLINFNQQCQTLASEENLYYKNILEYSETILLTTYCQNASQTGTKAKAWDFNKAIWMHCWIIIHTLIKMQAGINFNHCDSAEYAV